MANMTFDRDTLRALADEGNVAPAFARVGQLDVERVPVKMAHGQGEVCISFRPSGTVAGLFFLKAGAPPP